MSFLSPEILLSIKDLHLAAKTVVEGMLAGQHRSGAKGEGMEFSQYRSYQPGDDLRQLDWKLFARSDRYYIREAETERNVSVQLLVDASASMNHVDGNYTKLHYARYLAAALAYLANRQGDAVGLTSFKMGRFLSLAAQDSRQMARLYAELENLEAGGSFTEEKHFRNVLQYPTKRELIIFITDYYEQAGEISDLLATIASRNKEVMVLHLMGQNEMEMDYKGYTAVEDWETGQVVKVDPLKATKEYQKKLKTHLAAIRDGLLSKGVLYHRIQTNEPVDAALRYFLNLRNRTKN